MMGPNYAEMEAARTLRLDREYAEREREIREAVENEYFPTWDDLTQNIDATDFANDKTQSTALEAVWNALKPETQARLLREELDWRVQQWQ